MVQASWEAEELRASTLSLEDQLQEAQARGQGMQAQLSRTEHDLQAARSLVARLEVSGHSSPGVCTWLTGERCESRSCGGISSSGSCGSCVRMHCMRCPLGRTQRDAWLQLCISLCNWRQKGSRCACLTGAVLAAGLVDGVCKQVAASECEALPGLRADLKDARARGNELQIARDQLQARV